MTKKIPILLLFCWLAHGAFCQGNYVFTGAEVANYASVSLSTPGAQGWATYRGASPGYFSAVGASPYSNGSDANNVNGYVKEYTRTANTGYNFPVGTGADIRTLTTSGTIPASSIIAAAWILGDPSTSEDLTSPNQGAHAITSVGTGITAVSNVGEWDWQDLSNNAAGITVTVSIPNMTTFATAAQLRLVGWNGTNWQNLSGSTGASGNTEDNTLAGTMVSGITAIGIGTITTVLPLNLLSFTATPSNCAASLNWATTNEVGTSYFEVQQSTDGSDFTTISTVAAKGSGGTYTYTAAQNIGLAYYRLKMVDKDGTFTYSPIASLTTNCSNITNYMKMLPNPLVTGNGNITLSFNLGYKGNATIRVTDVLGRHILDNSIVVQDGTNQYSFSGTKLASGVYYVQLIGANGNLLGSTQKLVKQ